MVGLAETIFELLGDKGKKFLEGTLCEAPADFSCFKIKLNKTRERRLVYSIMVLFGLNRKNVFIVKDNIDEVLRLLEDSKRYVVVDKDVFKEKGVVPEIKTIFVPKKLTLSDMIEGENFVVVLEFGNNMFLVLGRKVAEVMDKKFLTFPPYLMKKILSNRLSSPVTRLVYNVRGDVTGVEYVEEIEIRGQDVLKGFPKLIARLDVFKGIVSLFGPVIEVEYADGITIRFTGEITYRNIKSLVDILKLLE